MSEWKEYTLSEIGTIARGKSKHRPRDASFLYGGKYPFIQTGDIKASNHKIYSYTQTYSESGLNQSKLWPINTLCITIAANIADTGILTFPACFPDSVIGFVADDSKCDIEFIEYLLQCYKKQIQSHSIGSVQDNINLGTFEKIKFRIPGLAIQKAISEILSSLDDKIELNNKINQELESLARLLFKRWFVDFEFPNENGQPYKASGGEMVDSDLGVIPKGWKIFQFSDVCEIIDCLHSKKPELLKNNTGFLYLQLSNIDDNGVLDLSEKFWITENDYKKWTSRIEVKEGDFVITNVGRSGAISRITKGVKAAIGRNMTAIRLKEKFKYNGFFTFLLLSDFMKKEIESKLDSGTILDALNVRSIPKLRFICDSKFNKIYEFEKIAESIWSKIEANRIENYSLVGLRDTLLPKLISGELQINEN